MKQRLVRFRKPRHARDEAPSNIRLSNRQYAALRIFTDETAEFAMNSESALSIDQRSFGSLFHRGYIAFDPEKGGFALTERGRLARRIFDETDVHRKTPAPQFSFYIRTIKALRRIA